MRLVLFILVLLIALPLLAQSGDPADPTTAMTDGATTQESTSEAAAETPIQTVQSAALPSFTPLPLLSDITVGADMPTPVIVTTLPPTAAPLPTLEASLVPTVLPSLTADASAATSEPTAALPTSIATEETSATATDAATEEISAPPTSQPFPTVDLSTAVVTSQALPLPLTLPALATEETSATATDAATEEISAPPTSQPFPTVDLSTAVVTSQALPLPLTLPALATMDDGAGDWLGSPNWSLQPREGGLAWLMVSAGSELLRWQTPIDLRGAATSVTLRFHSWFVGAGLATVQVSVDGLNWQPVSLVPASGGWVNVGVDLSSYIGSVIQISFAWQGTNGDTQDQWAVDTVVVVATTPTIVPPEPTFLPVTLLSPAEGEDIQTHVPTTTLSSTAAPTDIVLPTATSTETAVESNDDASPTPTHTLVSTATATATATATPSPTALACGLDANADGVVTVNDLSAFAQAALNTEVHETTVLYDLNQNAQIDIGDLQLLAGDLDASCSD